MFLYVCVSLGEAYPVCEIKVWNVWILTLTPVLE
jgi:hypothetical protein